MQRWRIILRHGAPPTGIAQHKAIIWQALIFPHSFDFFFLSNFVFVYNTKICMHKLKSLRAF
jgi:hypothetical protein